MTRDRRSFVAWVLACSALLWGCSSGLGNLHGSTDAGTEAGPGGSGGTEAGTGGSSGAEAGPGGSGGTEAGPGGSGGSAGDAGSTCSACNAGEYCQVSTGKCVSCGDLSQLHFGAPEPLTAVNANPAGGLRFPRVAGPKGNGLMYVANDNTLTPPGTAIWFAGAPDTSYGTRLSPTGSSQSGVLSGSVGFEGNLLFDQLASQQSTQRSLYVTTLSGQGMGTPTALPAPFNTPGTSNSSIAVASSAGRAWWMQDNGSGAQLETALLQQTSAPVAVKIRIQLATQTFCPIPASDISPWVTPDGALMLFSTVQFDAGCQPINNGVRDLYSIHLGPGGVPTNNAAAQSLSLDQPGVNQVDPSLSRDLCTLFYAADNKLYRAPRD